MQLRDKNFFNTWYKNQGDSNYGKDIFEFATLWMETMEYLMSEGYDLDEILFLAEETGYYLGISGFMYGCSAEVISHCWIHGEEFRKLYNLDKQIHNEGEEANKTGKVLNPAMIEIG